MKPNLSKAIDDHRDQLSGSVVADNVLDEGRRSHITMSDGSRLLVFTVQDQAIVDSKIGPGPRLTNLIDTLIHKPNEWFKWFMTYLESIGHKNVANEIRTAADKHQNRLATLRAACAAGENNGGLASGHPVQIIRNDNNRLILETENLHQVLCNDRWINLKVVVIAVAGNFRTGKSFLINFMKLFLENECNKATFLADADTVVDGFRAATGARRVTSGIWIWSEPFLVQLDNGETVAVLLMDTQGTFDQQSDMKLSTSIFALSTLLSSCQVYNLMRAVGADSLHHLQLFIDYGRTVKQSTTSQYGGSKPFQSLLFLVRDWSFTEDYQYGFSNDYLTNNVLTNEEGPDELVSIRSYIDQCFTSINSFLLPYPGSKVRGTDVRLGRLKPEFVVQVKNLIFGLLCPDKLIVKKIGSVDLTCGNLFEFFKIYCDQFSGDDVPEVGTIFQATMKTQHRTLISNALRLYQTSMDSMDSNASAEDFERAHVEKRSQAIEYYRSKPKLGGVDVANDYESQLKDNIQNIFEPLYDQIKSKQRLILHERMTKQHRTLISDALRQYQTSMNSVESDASPEDFERAHVEKRSQAIDYYRNKPKLEGAEVANDYEGQLKDNIQNIFEPLYEKIRSKQQQRLILHERMMKQHRTLISDALRQYQTSMKSLEINASPGAFASAHEKKRSEAINYYRNKPKLGGTDVANDYEGQLKDNIQNIFESLYHQVKTLAAQHNQISGLVTEHVEQIKENNKDWFQKTFRW